MNKDWRCHHGWLRGEQCEICNTQPTPEQRRHAKVITFGLIYGMSAQTMQRCYVETVFGPRLYLPEINPPKASAAQERAPLLPKQVQYEPQHEPRN